MAPRAASLPKIGVAGSTPLSAAARPTWPNRSFACWILLWDSGRMPGLTCRIGGHAGRGGVRPHASEGVCARVLSWGRRGWQAATHGGRGWATRRGHARDRGAGQRGRTHAQSVYERSACRGLPASARHRHPPPAPHRADDARGLVQASGGADDRHQLVCGQGRWEATAAFSRCYRLLSGREGKLAAKRPARLAQAAGLQAPNTKRVGGGGWWESKHAGQAMRAQHVGSG